MLLAGLCGQSREDERLKCLSLVSLQSYGDRVVSTASRGDLGTFLDGLVAVLDGPGAVLEGLGAVLRASGAVLEPLGAVLGTAWGGLGQS